MAVLRRQGPTRFDKRANVCRFDAEIHAEGHNFHAGDCSVVRYRDLVAKIKIANFFLAY